MVRSVLILLLTIIMLLALVGCVQKYPIVTLEEIEPMKDYLPQKQYILLEEPAEINDINKVMLFLKDKDIKKAKELVSSLRNKGEKEKKLNFHDGLIAFFEKKYSVALHMLELAEIDSYKHLKYLIIGDCMYEMMIDPNYKNFTTKQILDNYQKALDYCKTEIYKEIIKMHIKYAKYGGIS